MLKKISYSVLTIFIIILLSTIITATENPIIKIKSLENEESNLNITYEFDNSRTIGERATITIRLLNEFQQEIYTEKDEFRLNKDAPIERNVLIKIPKNSTKEVSVTLSLDSHPDISTTKSLPLNSASITGKTIFSNNKNYLIGYGFFIGVILIVVIVFSYRSTISKK